jgi:hypothetical protein
MVPKNEIHVNPLLFHWSKDLFTSFRKYVDVYVLTAIKKITKMQNLGDVMLFAIWKKHIPEKRD